MNVVVRSMFAIVTVAVLAAPPLAAQNRVSQAGTPSLPPLSAEEQLAMDELSPRFGREYALIRGWFRDRPVLYYDFGWVPEPVTPGRVYWPIHGFDAHGNPVAIRGQRPIFSEIPAHGSYSGLWRLVYVITADHVQPNRLRDVASAEALVRSARASMKETEIIVNLPIVPRGSRLARDSTAALAGWYQGRDVEYFDFGRASATPVEMWRFARGVDAGGQPNLLVDQSSVVDSIPAAPAYPDLWSMRVVRADSAYVPNSVRSLAALRGTQMAVDAPGGVRNLPIAMVDETRIQRAASPLREFADLRSPFPPRPTPP